jgi:orotidine-5'-phosphate decarboxylase
MEKKRTIDTLIERIDKLSNPTVVGLDPTIEMIPEGVLDQCYSEFGSTPRAVAEAFFRFNKEIIDHVCDIVPAVKPQVAMYEKYGLDGVSVYLDTIAYAREKGLIVIGDVKRGDISSTAAAYAGHLAGVDIRGEHFDLWKEDAVTVNPYLGTDGITPFVDAAEESGRMIFVLVKTSNPSSSELQDLIANADSGGEPIYVKVARLTAEWGKDAIGVHGYSSVGAVVGATHPRIGQELRQMLPNTFFLVPGYGAQGASAEDLKGFFDNDGRGCIVNSSRGITAAWKKQNNNSPGEAARTAAIEMRDALRIVAR